jgi:hypothetical protein
MKHKSRVLYTLIEEHYNAAASNASKYQLARRRHPLLVSRCQAFEQRNKKWLHIEPMRRIMALICMPGHICIAIFEGMQLLPILQGIIFAHESMPESKQFWMSFLAIGILFISSLLAGFCLDRIRISDDLIVPGKRKISVGWTLCFLLLALIYIGVISLLIQELTRQNPDFSALNILILFAVLELAVGGMAATGYTYTIIYLQNQLNKRAVRKNEYRTRYYAEQSDRSFRHYCRAIALYNAVQNTSIRPQDTPAISEAISYHQGFFCPPEFNTVTILDDGQEEDEDSM